MLTKFAVTNYRGFANRIELDLSNPSNYESAIGTSLFPKASAGVQ